MLSTNISGQTFPGLTLKAWAYVRSDWVLIKGFNIASVGHPTTGQYTVVFSSPMNNVAALMKIQVDPGGGSTAGWSARRATWATGQVQVNIYNETGVAIDAAFYIEVWE